MTLSWLVQALKKYRYRNLPEVKEVKLVARNFSRSDFSEGFLNDMEDAYRNRIKSGEGDVLSYPHPRRQKELSLRVGSQKPGEGRPTEHTNVEVVNHLFYREGDEHFDVPDYKLIEIDETPDVSHKTEVSRPESFANIMDQNYGENVFHVSDENIWISGDYWFKFGY